MLPLFCVRGPRELLTTSQRGLHCCNHILVVVKSKFIHYRTLDCNPIESAVLNEIEKREREAQLCGP